MSTRATYQFKDSKDNLSPNTTIYIHMDGYPEGAATYFWNMHHEKNRCGGFADRFLRGNPNAELTKSHDAHGDTEYWYTMDGETLTAAEVYYAGDDYRHENRRGKVFFKGHYAEFINQYGKDGFMDNFSPLKKVKASYYGQECWLTFEQLKEMYETALKEYTDYREKFPNMSGNLRNYENNVATLKESLKNF